MTHDFEIDELDERKEVGWSGDLAVLLKFSPDGWPISEVIAQPSGTVVGGVGLVVLSGIVTRTAWLEFAAETCRLSHLREVDRQVVMIDCPAAQQAGFEAAAEAVQSSQRRGCPVFAHIHHACGYAFLLAHNCDLIFAEAAAPIGYLDGDCPLHPLPPEFAALGRDLASDHLRGLLYETRKPPRREAMKLMHNAEVHAEQVEHLGAVHRLTPDLGATLQAVADLKL
ncbi:hypothetical protein OAS39_00650 [Pirellulales bacterium]|nr:hypothetical protein [Pirellulales bacterium]